METTPFKAEEYLETEEHIQAYLEECAKYPEMAETAVETVRLARELNSKREAR